MNKKIKSSFDSIDESVNSFFQKLPELLVLIAIPLALAFHIFLRPQLSKDTAYVTPVVRPTVEAELDIQSDLDSKVEVLEKLFQSASESATLSSPSANMKSNSTVIPNLDLVGPWTCSSTGVNSGSKKLYIENKSVKLVTQKGAETSHVLLKDGCLYSWSNNGSGVKQCEGISEMVSLAEMAISSGLVDISSVISEMASGSDDSIKELVSTCKKSQSVAYIFAIPQGIKWTEDSALLDSLQK